MFRIRSQRAKFRSVSEVYRERVCISINISFSMPASGLPVPECISYSCRSYWVCLPRAALLSVSLLSSCVPPTQHALPLVVSKEAEEAWRVTQRVLSSGRKMVVTFLSNTRLASAQSHDPSVTAREAGKCSLQYGHEEEREIGF